MLLRFALNNLSLYLFFFTISTALAIGKINRLDKHGNQHGKWVNYWNDSLKIIMDNGRYRHGKPVGRWSDYSYQGVLQRSEKYRGDKVKIKYYHPNKKIESKGVAYTKEEPDGLHFYFQGEWKYYNEKGKLYKITFYEKGHRINEKLIP